MCPFKDRIAACGSIKKSSEFRTAKPIFHPIKKPKTAFQIISEIDAGCPIVISCRVGRSKESFSFLFNHDICAIF